MLRLQLGLHEEVTILSLLQAWPIAFKLIVKCSRIIGQCYSYARDCSSIFFLSTPCPPLFVNAITMGHNC